MVIDNNYNKKIFSVNFFYKQYLPIIIENRIGDRHPIIPVNRLLFSSPGQRPCELLPSLGVRRRTL